jgi:Cu2+-containing amine oxidase
VYALLILHASGLFSTQSVTPGHKARPHIDMDRYLADEERLPGSDLVLWVNVGVQHHTHSEDIPVTTTNGNTVRSALHAQWFLLLLVVG